MPQFTGFSEKTIDFLFSLRLNNNKPWFEEHRDDYIRYVKTPFTLFSNEITAFVASLDKSHDFTVRISRINKDMRYARGGAVYQDHLWMCPKPVCENWDDAPVFYAHLTPDEWVCGMGYFRASRNTMDALRARIDANEHGFLQKLKEFEAASDFSLMGESYKRPIREKSPQIAEYYQKKELYYARNRPAGEKLFSRACVEEIMDGFKRLMPVYRFLWSLHSETVD